jgi:branched-chain amino acid transport system substrate-binding protein
MKISKIVLTCCMVAGLAPALAACGSSSKTTPAAGNTSGSTTAAPSGGKTVDIYSSLPLLGPLSADTVPALNGEKLALAQANNKAGQFNVKFISLDDATAAAANYTVSQCATDGRTAAADPKAIAYIGEFNSGCTEASLPILNKQMVPMISPANTYVGLTTNEPGSAPGEPAKYYPSGVRTYLRIVPRDSIQAAADALAMKNAGCTRIAVANDKTPYGAGIAQQIELIKKFYGINVVGNTGVNPMAPNFRSYAATIKGQGANCFFYGGLTSTGGVQITKDVHSAIPTAKLFGPDGMCLSSWTDPKQGGVPLSLDPLMQCTVATLDLTAYPGGKTFLKAYEAKYGGGVPAPYAIYGYEAMKLVLDTIAGLGAQGDSKSAVLHALFATKNRNSVLGTYSFNANGDTTLKAYGLYKVVNGQLKFDKTITPSHIV